MCPAILPSMLAREVRDSWQRALKLPGDAKWTIAERPSRRAVVAALAGGALALVSRPAAAAPNSCAVKCADQPKARGAQCRQVCKACAAGAAGTCFDAATGAFVCRDIANDAANCGGCGRTCPSNLVCSAGACVCANPPACRSDQVIDPQTCQYACPQGTGVCNVGIISAGGGDQRQPVSCPTGQCCFGQLDGESAETICCPTGSHCDVLPDYSSPRCAN